MSKNYLNGRTKLIIWIFGIIFLAGVTYATIYVNAGNISDNSEDIEKVESRTEKTNSEVVGLKKDVFYIKEKVDYNSKVQQQILDEIKELRK